MTEDEKQKYIQSRMASKTRKHYMPSEAEIAWFKQMRAAYPAQCSKLDDEVNEMALRHVNPFA